MFSHNMSTGMEHAQVNIMFHLDVLSQHVYRDGTCLTKYNVFISMFSRNMSTGMEHAQVNLMFSSLFSLTICLPGWNMHKSI